MIDLLKPTCWQEKLLHLSNNYQITGKMAIYNTASDAANTAVRSFLTKVGEHYLGRIFNTGSGQGKRDWLRIRDEVFEGKCAYCEETPVALQIEHLLMFNRSEYGLHHPGNVAPCCKGCNKRQRKPDKTYVDWIEHLELICSSRNEINLFEERKNKILTHIRNENYPELNENEQQAIRVIANSLYENIKLESEKSLNMYRELDEAFVRNND